MDKEEINFYAENEFDLMNQEAFRGWINRIITSEGMKSGEISFIFCDDDYLLEVNQKYLNHDTYTDIISFDNSVGRILSGDIFISTERVKDNAIDFGVEFDEEIKRVMAHGILHFCGFKDKSAEEKEEMRRKENEKIKLFHVEQSK